MAQFMTLACGFPIGGDPISSGGIWCEWAGNESDSYQGVLRGHFKTTWIYRTLAENMSFELPLSKVAIWSNRQEFAGKVGGELEPQRVMAQSLRETSDTIPSMGRANLAWVFGILLALLVWGYWNTLSEAALAWRGAQYSHGLIIPLVAVVLLWVRRYGGAFDWQPRAATERWRLALVFGFLIFAWIFHVISESLAQRLSPDELVPMVAASGFVLIAALFYATCLLGWAAFAAHSWLLSSEKEDQNRPEQATRQLRDQPTGEESPNAAQTLVFHGRYGGLLMLISAIVLRLMFAYMGLDVAEMWTFPLAVIGVTVSALGWKAARWCWPAAVVLVFAFPLPFTVERELLVPLQGLAARGGAYLLQTLGLEASTEGAHFIRLGEFQLGVVEQCSGLRMTTVFVALVFVYVVVVPMPKWQIPVLLLSAIPIALLVNIFRITVTGSLYVFGNRELAQRVFHDWAGYLMPLAAVVLLLLLRLLLDSLFVRIEEQDLPLAQRVTPVKADGK